jgi:hypothetical protein
MSMRDLKNVWLLGVVFLMGGSALAQNTEKIIPVVDQIPARKAESLLGMTLKEGCPVKRKSLRTVIVPYLNDKGEKKEGILIVHKKVTKEVLFLFTEMFQMGFVIHKIAPASYYDGDDNQLMKYNVTSAFNCRRTTDGIGYSNHSYGTTIDINPLWNPYVKGKKVLPPKGKAFAKHRDKLKQPGVLKKDGRVVKIFKEMGWTWGGDWKSLKDYQHFEKKINLENVD